MGSAEIRRRFGGISRQRVNQLTRRPDWPAPYDELVQGTVWRWEDVEAWVAEHRPDLQLSAQWQEAESMAGAAARRAEPRRDRPSSGGRTL
jgi:hypothetical protein